MVYLERFSQNSMQTFTLQAAYHPNFQNNISKMTKIWANHKCIKKFVEVVSFNL